MTFLATDHPVVAAIALIAALYHLANHSVYKALLFVGTGVVEAGTGTRDLDRLGGIIRRMPWTSAFFLVGVLAISALPPLNGFVSEWLTLQTVLRSAILASTPIKIVFAISGALLALTAGLAVTCFAKVFAMGFLGMPRSQGAAAANEAHPVSWAPLALLAGSASALGILPTYVIPVIDRAVVPLAHESATAALVPPFFRPDPLRQENIPPAFVAEFHDLGAQVGREALPGRGLVVLHRGGERNPVVFAMSTSYMLVAFAVILALTFVVFQFLSGREDREPWSRMGWWPAPSLARNHLHCDRILQSGARHLRGYPEVLPPGRIMSKRLLATFAPPSGGIMPKSISSIDLLSTRL